MSEQELWSKDLKTMTDENLRIHRDECYRRASEIDREFSRRAALPYVWENETQTIRQIRLAMNKPAPGEDGNPPEWKKPTTILDAHIQGDKVTHNGFTWVAVGSGAIFHEPGVTDPVMGDRWDKVDGPVSESEASTNDTLEA